MKKGCFLTTIISLTFLVLVIYYFVRYHGEELIEVGTQQLVEYAQTKLEGDIDNLEDNGYVDSLKVVLGNYFSQIKELDIKTELERIEELADDFEVILMDSKVDSAEFDFITNRLVRYEQRKEN